MPGLEIGVGVGSNWIYLPEGNDYTGIDPDEYMLQRARRHASEQSRTFDLRPVGVEQLPFPDATFDMAFTTLTFCSVALPGAGAAATGRAAPG